MGAVERLFRRKVRTPVRRAARKKIRQATSYTCTKCGKPYTNYLTHTCTVRTDFRKRAAAAKRREAATARREKAAAKRAAAKARRKAAAGRRKAVAAARKARAKTKAPAGARPRSQHNYRTCRDPECQRHACQAYREGIENCPLPHQ